MDREGVASLQRDDLGVSGSVSSAAHRPCQCQADHRLCPAHREMARDDEGAVMLGLSGLKLYVGLGMVLALVLLSATSAVLWSRIEAKEATIVSVAQQRDLAAGDAARWRQAAEQRQGIIDRQALTLRRLENDGQSARAIAA